MNFNGRKVAIKLFTEFEKHVLSDSFSKQFQVQKHVQQYSWICFHYWLLQKKLSNMSIPNKVKNPFLSYNMKKCMKQYTKQHVNVYSDSFNGSVYEELQRRKNTLCFSLDDYFVYDFRQKPLIQIIREDLYCSSEKAAKYILENWEKEVDAEMLAEGQYNWQRVSF